jgi:hypothetical protein
MSIKVFCRRFNPEARIVSHFPEECSFVFSNSHDSSDYSGDHRSSWQSAEFACGNILYDDFTTLVMANSSTSFGFITFLKVLTHGLFANAFILQIPVPVPNRSVLVIKHF